MDEGGRLAIHFSVVLIFFLGGGGNCADVASDELCIGNVKVQPHVLHFS